MANNTIRFSEGYSGEDWSKYTDTLTTGSVTISPQEPLNITGQVYNDPMQGLRSMYSYDDMSTAEMAEEDYHEGSKVRRVTKTEQWFPDGEGEFAGPDKPLTSTYVEYIGGRK